MFLVAVVDRRGVFCLQSQSSAEAKLPERSASTLEDGVCTGRQSQAGRGRRSRRAGEEDEMEQSDTKEKNT